jgi:aspartate/methionine/tyrosine aminotransferase
MTSWDAARYLAKECKVVTVPGSIFGNRGEGYLRVSFAANVEILEEGILRIKKGIESIL